MSDDGSRATWEIFALVKELLDSVKLQDQSNARLLAELGQINERLERIERVMGLRAPTRRDPD
jgi:hypothetical protein